MAVLAVMLVQDAWESSRTTLEQATRQQCITATRELQQQFAERASLLGAAAGALRFEAEDVSLQGLSAAVLRSYEEIEGGFLVGAQKRVAGHAGGPGVSSARSLSAVEADLVSALGQRASEAADLIVDNAADGTDLLVAAAVRVDARDAVAWTLKRLSGVNDPAAQRRRWWLAGLVLSGLLGLGGIVSISIRLRQGVASLNTGLARLEQDFNYRLPSISGDFGKVARAVNRMADVRGSLETTLRRQDRLAALGKVVAGVAHEIRNPLNALSLTLQLLERRVRKGHATGDEAREAILEVERLERILSRLLAFGRPEMENRHVQDIEPLLDRALRVVDDHSRRKHVTVRLSEASRPAALQADVDALAIEQVLINLFLNAIDASPEGSVVNVRVADESDGVRIDVQDKGLAIPDGVRDHIFDPYFTTKENGTGLGLAVSREIVCHHGGTIDFESNGSGTTFTLKLPSNGKHS
jgi:signal transduction histidine kinase